MANLRATRDIGRTLQAITNEINKINKLIKETTEGKAKESQKIRVVKNGNGKYQLEFKHRDGWIQSDSSESTGFKLKDN